MLGFNVRRYRKERGMTQSELADKIGVAQSFVGLIERDERQPSTKTLFALADALGVTLDMLRSSEPALAAA